MAKQAKKKGPRKPELSPQAVIALLERAALILRSGQHVGGLNPAQWSALRYLSRANAFSNSVSSLARYLGATRGTVSQSVQMLEKKGLVVCERRGSDGRSQTISLTQAGLACLSRDPLLQLEQSFVSLKGRDRKRISRGLSRWLGAETRRSGLPSFGDCRSCSYLVTPDAAATSHHCRFKDAEIVSTEFNRLCEFYTRKST